ncbi:hypothetical protein, partial [Xylella fastidiosa]|uniref:hypothetical protein n=1 Tax=Xylella fastidiosa TaxID=2371 RepID=UPI001E539273
NCNDSPNLNTLHHQHTPNTSVQIHPQLHTNEKSPLTVKNVLPQQPHSCLMPLNTVHRCSTATSL